MDLHDYLNVCRVYRMLSARWGCSVGEVKERIGRILDRSWEMAQSKPEEKALWDRYFPDGKPTPDRYILLLGRAHEQGEEVPYLFRE